MKRPSLSAAASIAGAAVMGFACVACGSGHQPKTTPSSGHPVLRHGAPVATSSAVPLKGAHYTPAAGGRTRVSATGHHRAAVATPDRSGMGTFRLPRSTRGTGTGCGGQQTVHVAGRRPLPVRVMCPPP